MRLNTTMFWAWRNVGDKDSPVVMIEATPMDAIKQFMKWVVETSVATRFQLAVGRSEAEVMIGVSPASSKQRSNESVDDMLAEMMTELNININEDSAS